MYFYVSKIFVAEEEKVRGVFINAEGAREIRYHKTTSNLIKNHLSFVNLISLLRKLKNLVNSSLHLFGST